MPLMLAQGDTCNDCLVTAFCIVCALTQEYRELHIRKGGVLRFWGFHWLQLVGLEWCHLCMLHLGHGIRTLFASFRPTCITLMLVSSLSFRHCTQSTANILTMRLIAMLLHLKLHLKLHRKLHLSCT
jgi:hypothetical protein